MFLRFNLAVIAGIAIAFAPQVVLSNSPLYRVVDLGSLSGEDGVSFGEGINDSGTVVGTSGLNEIVAPRPFLYQGQMIDIGSGPSQKGRALAINNLDQVVGDAQVVTAEGYDAFQAFLFENNMLTNLGSLGGIESQARDVNDIGQVVGASQFVPPPDGIWVWPGGPIIDQRYHAFIYEDGVMHDLHELSGLTGDNSGATGINNLGQIIGTVDGRGFLYDNGSLIDLSTIGGVRTVPLRINNAGAITIFSEDESGSATGFVFDNGVATPLGSLGGGQSVGRDINDAGTIVGQATISELSTIGTPIWHAFIYEHGSMIDLNSFIRQDSGWVLVDAAGVNAHGHIVGSGTIHGTTHAYILVPVPEPSTVALLAILLVAGSFASDRSMSSCRS